jgi:hypothetical protein
MSNLLFFEAFCPLETEPQSNNTFKGGDSLDYATFCLLEAMSQLEYRVISSSGGENV